MAADHEAEELLEGLTDPRERAERIAIVEHLLELGVPSAEIRAAAAEGRLVLLAVERALDATAPRYTTAQVGARSGLGPAAVERLRASFGLGVPPPGEPGLGAPDLEEARRARDVYALGFTEEQLVRLNREVGLAAARVAAAMVQATARAVLRPGEGEHELAHRLTLAASRLLPMAGEIAAYAVREHLRAAIGRAAIGPAELRAGRPTELEEVTVLFADLVGFTALGRAEGAERLGDVAERLAALAAGAVEPPAALVKTIGDAAMFVAPEPRPLLAVAKSLVAAAERDPALPGIRVGLASGVALASGGDWFGEPVNIASRVCDAAPPGAVLATTGVRNDVPEAEWEDAGTFPLKGLAEPVRLWRVPR